jgi:hypothetical protein
MSSTANWKRVNGRLVRVESILDCPAVRNYIASIRPTPTVIPYEDDKFKWDYDDKGVLCRYNKETQGWEVMEDCCDECGHRPDECDCGAGCCKCGVELTDENWNTGSDYRICDPCADEEDEEWEREREDKEGTFDCPVCGKE